MGTKVKMFLTDSYKTLNRIPKGLLIAAIIVPGGLLALIAFLCAKSSMKQAPAENQTK